MSDYLLVREAISEIFLGSKSFLKLQALPFLGYKVLSSTFICEFDGRVQLDEQNQMHSV